MLKLAVLLSGSGRTLDNFHRCIKEGRLRAQIVVVVANVAAAPGLEKARRYGYPAFYAEGSPAINAILAGYDFDIICLAGFLQLYQPPPAFERAVINIHPSLIPAFAGAGWYGHHVHEAVQARGCLVSGCTVHFADEHYDEGPIIWQQAVQLDFDDDAQTIADKVFAAECSAFPKALQLVDENGIDFFWRRGRYGQ